MSDLVIYNRNGMTVHQADFNRMESILLMASEKRARRFFACRHEVYYEETQRLTDDIVVACCHKCHALLAGNGLLAMGVKIMGHRPKPCPTCKQPLRQPEKDHP